MASIRRTQSPFHLNGGGGATPFSAQSPPHKIIPNGKPSSLSVSLRRALSRPRFSLYRYLLFFTLGFVLGLAPFGRVDDVRTHNFDSGQTGKPREEFVTVEHVELIERGKKVGLNHPKQVIIVTPTYNRAMQAYFLNRLGQVLKLVNPPLVWVVVEMNEASVETAGFLRKMGVMYRHLVCKENSTDVKDRGVHQRNTALEHIERHKLDGIVYFADDDNVYSHELFERLREIRRFGTWPVAMLAHSKAKAILEGPVCNESQVIGWHTNEKSKRLRRFHVDMSGFAFNSTMLWDRRRWPRPTSTPIRQLDTVKEGFQETTFIEQMVEDEYQMEGITPNCSMIMNWHLHLEGSKFVYPRGWLLQKNLDVVQPIV